MQINTEQIEYMPIAPNRDLMEPFLQDDFSRMVFDTYRDFYPHHGYDPPWIGYFAIHNGVVVGVGGYKGKPIDGQVEIAYGTVPAFEGHGISSHTCGYLTRQALMHDPDLRVIARTLTSENASTSILRKNGFVYVDVVEDPEDGEVWEWEFRQES